MRIYLPVAVVHAAHLRVGRNWLVDTRRQGRSPTIPHARALIQVARNGSYMKEEDMLLCIPSHGQLVAGEVQGTARWTMEVDNGQIPREVGRGWGGVSFGSRGERPPRRASRLPFLLRVSLRSGRGQRHDCATPKCDVGGERTTSTRAVGVRRRAPSHHGRVTACWWCVAVEQCASRA